MTWHNDYDNNDEVDGNDKNKDDDNNIKKHRCLRIIETVNIRFWEMPRGLSFISLQQQIQWNPAPRPGYKAFTKNPFIIFCSTFYIGSKEISIVRHRNALEQSVTIFFHAICGNGREAVFCNGDVVLLLTVRSLGRSDARSLGRSVGWFVGRSVGIAHPE